MMNLWAVAQTTHIFDILFLYTSTCGFLEMDWFLKCTKTSKPLTTEFNADTQVSTVYVGPDANTC